MRDPDYILSTLLSEVNSQIEPIEYRLLQGSIKDMEDYQYNLGLRNALIGIRDYLNDLTRGE